MRALVWHGKSDVRCDNVADPRIEDPRDVIVKITATAICGSDLHLYDGYMPAMEDGDILGHEPMGKVVEVGKRCEETRVGDRSWCPSRSPVANASFAKRNSIPAAIRPIATPKPPPNSWVMRRLVCLATLTSQATILEDRRNICGCPCRRQSAQNRERFAERRAGSFSFRYFPDRLHGGRERADRTGRHRSGLGLWARWANLQFKVHGCWAPGGVIAIDRVPERLRMAEERHSAEIINFEKIEGGVYDRLQEMTKAVGRTAASTRSALRRMGAALRCSLGQSQGRGLASDRSRACIARSDYVLP